MIDVYVSIRDGHFQGFIPRQAIYWGGPSKERIAEIHEEFPVSADGWIYRRLPGGKYQRWHRWKEWN